MKKILMVLLGPFPPDIRVEKEISSLIKFGFEIDLIHYESKNKKINFSLPGLNLITCTAPTTLVHKLLNEFHGYDKSMVSYIRNFISSGDYAYVHAHDLQAAYCAILAKGRGNIKVIADFHENMPEATEAWRSSLPPFKRYILNLIHPKSKITRQEKIVCDEADLIISVVPEMVNFLSEKHDFELAKCRVISNFETLDFKYTSKSLSYSTKPRFNILYTGGFGYHRGIHTAITAMRFLKNTDICLRLVGGGNTNLLAWYDELIKEHSLEETVSIIDWVPANDIPAYIHAADLCIVPHEKNQHTDNTIPHKLYQYMTCGRPVLVSNCDPLERVVNEAQSGLVFKAGSPKDFSDKVLEIYNNREISTYFGSNGYKYVHQKGNAWENEALKLREIYRTSH